MLPLLARTGIRSSSTPDIFRSLDNAQGTCEEMKSEQTKRGTNAGANTTAAKSRAPKGTAETRTAAAAEKQRGAADKQALKERVAAEKQTKAAEKERVAAEKQSLAAA